MDEFFLKAANFYNDKERIIPQRFSSPLGYLDTDFSTIVNDFTYCTYPNILSHTYLYRLSYNFGDASISSYNYTFSLKMRDARYELYYLKMALDGIITNYYHNKWMKQNGEEFLIKVLSDLKKKLNESKRSKKIKDSATRLINEFIKEKLGEYLGN